MLGIPIVDKILTLLNLLVVCASVALMYYSHRVLKTPETNRLEEIERLKNEAIQLNKMEPIKLKKLTVNLYSRRNKLRFLDVELNILPTSIRHVDKIKGKEALIADSVIEVVGNMTAEEINSVTGKILLEDRIKRMVNNKFPRPVIKKIFFSQFVVQ